MPLVWFIWLKIDWRHSIKLNQIKTIKLRHWISGISGITGNQAAFSFITIQLAACFLFLLNNGARWIFTSFSLVIMALMLGNRFETSHYASWSSYECGLFQKTVARVKYEITFYTVALTFLIFEYELLFIFPLLLSLQVSHKSF